MASSYDREQRERVIGLGLDLERALVNLVLTPGRAQQAELARVLARGRARSRKLMALFLSTDLDRQHADRVWDDRTVLDTQLRMVRAVSRQVTLWPPNGVRR